MMGLWGLTRGKAPSISRQSRIRSDCGFLGANGLEHRQGNLLGVQLGIQQVTRQAIIPLLCDQDAEHDTSCKIDLMSDCKNEPH